MSAVVDLQEKRPALPEKLNRASHEGNIEISESAESEDITPISQTSMYPFVEIYLFTGYHEPNPTFNQGFSLIGINAVQN